VTYLEAIVTATNKIVEWVNTKLEKCNADTLDGHHADAFATSEHTHDYAGSSEAGGAATKAIGDKNGYDITRQYMPLTNANSTAIAESSDLNTVEFLKVGTYYVGQSAAAATLTNCPTTYAFMMTVIAPLHARDIGKEESSTWVYRIRKIITWTGEEYIQDVHSTDTAGDFTYGNWRKNIIGDHTGVLDVAHGGTGVKTEAEIALKSYPVGAIYLSMNSTSPGALFGGEWERIRGRFLLAADDTYAADSIGGEATHKLTVGEMPSHSHYVPNIRTTAQDAGYAYAESWGGGAGNRDIYTDSAGGGQSHNNMPPYLAVYMWRRIA
jgi:hypothetical protein